MVKICSLTSVGKAAAIRYSAAEVAQVEKAIVAGTPDVHRITTAHVEKQNHTLPRHCRLARLTNAFRKESEDFRAAVVLNFAYYHFGKIHKSLRLAPAPAAGFESSAGTVEERIKRCGE